MPDLDVRYDRESDVLTIAGVKYTGELFRALGLASPGTWLRVESRVDDVITVFTVSEETEKVFDFISRKK
jgi:hypothetical protein